MPAKKRLKTARFKRDFVIVWAGVAGKNFEDQSARSPHNGCRGRANLSAWATNRSASEAKAAQPFEPLRLRSSLSGVRWDEESYPDAYSAAR